MKSPVLSDSIWRPIVIILAILVLLQLIFSRQVFDVTISTYRVIQAFYFQDGTRTGQYLMGQNVSLNSTQLEAIQLFLNGSKDINQVKNLGLKLFMANSTVISMLNGTMKEFRSSTGKNGLAGLRSLLSNLLSDTSAAPAMPKCMPVLGSTFIFDRNTTAESLDTSSGGEWKPASCQPTTTVALIIPFRDRHSHLREFLPYMHSFMQKQQLHYRIYVVEQYDNSTFNRAKLMNVGYKEAVKQQKYDCYVFHDVDLLPLDERIGYNCSQKGPLHLAAAMDKFGFAMPYSGFFGGACAFTEKQLQKINGFSNKFVGWGGEDDDIEARVRLSGQETQRYPIQIARYHMIKHGPDKGNEANPQRHKLLEQTKKNWLSDGLNSLSYEVVNVSESLLYTKVSVNVA